MIAENLERGKLRFAVKNQDVIASIVTYNKRDFKEADKFGLRVLDSRELLAEIGEI